MISHWLGSQHCLPSDMSSFSLNIFLALTASVSGSSVSDCSYLGLVNHLNLRISNDILTVVRPVKNWTDVTLVKMDMYLYGILDVNEKSQTVTSHIWVNMYWLNEFLIWNSSDFCGIDNIIIPASLVWIPDIFIQEDASDSGSIQMSNHLHLTSDGHLTLRWRQRLTSTCRFNLKYFPFDTQTCNITFSPMTVNDDILKLDTITNDTILTMISSEIMITRGEWRLRRMEVLKKNGPYHSQIIYMVKITRKPMLYVTNFIMPLFYLLVLDLASFFISEARGEKLSFKVTVMLSISVLLLILQDILPSTESNVPMIAIYCVTIFALVGLSVLEAMLICFLIDMDDYYGNDICKRSDENIQVDVQVDRDQNNELVEVVERKDVDSETSMVLSAANLLKLTLEELKAVKQEGGRENKKQFGVYAKIAFIIDCVFFAIYFVTVLSFLTYMQQKWIPNDYM